MRAYDVADPQERAVGIEVAATVLKYGGVICAPSEVGYAWVGDAFSRAATDTIRRMRGIADDVPLQVLVSGTTVMSALANPNEDAIRLAEAFWPGMLSIVAPLSPSLAVDVGGGSSVVLLRQPSHDVLRELLEAVGPLIASRALTWSGDVVAGPEDARPVAHDVGAFLTADEVAASTKSTVVDTTRSPAAVLREGPIDSGQLEAVLGYAPVTDVR